MSAPSQHAGQSSQNQVRPQAQAHLQPAQATSEQLFASLGAFVKPGSHMGNLSHAELVGLLVKNLPQLLEFAKQGKLNEPQMHQLRVLSVYQRAQTAQAQAQASGQAQAQASGQAPAQQAAPAPQPKPIMPLQLHPHSQPQSQPAPTQQQPAQTPHQTPTTQTPASALSINPALKRKAAGDDTPIGSTSWNLGISSPLTTTNPGAQAWPNTTTQARPTLSGGLPAGRVSGTPAHVEKVPEDLSMYGVGELRVGQRKNTLADQSMRRSIQDLVSSIDPNVKLEPEVEDLLLDIADEFIDSVTNFGCRLAKHRGGDTLEVRDLQLHLERNHNIRVPGFASDETRFSITQSGAAGAAGAGGKKTAGQTTHMTLRSSRLAAVQQAKKDAKHV
ncbi:hypothetical protein M422DRAFT_32720 [Sphaerobolus stellatus SS14]|uniref:TBP-associated factor 12 n=1 Tax=Sphaerobolus stellatus (strain SS14) TaxID=990650 RepID=A0A0C9U8V0_SPHS4|nr:hypothetical protein M422DRAFT_32720 [Sphaerobolus stellatus SS14]